MKQIVRKEEGLILTCLLPEGGWRAERRIPARPDLFSRGTERAGRPAPAGRASGSCKYGLRLHFRRGLEPGPDALAC